MDGDKWYALSSVAEIPSPALLLYPERIQYNIDLMIRMVGDPLRLRPHVKTHKMAELVEMQLGSGIRKFKCATIAEAELLGRCGAPDVLLAMQPVGPNMARFFSLQQEFPSTRFSTITDDPGLCKTLSAMGGKRNGIARLFVDLNVGMNRSGISPELAPALYREIATLPNLEAVGLHAYDGHLRQTGAEAREKACNLAFKSVDGLRKKLEAEGHPKPVIVAGGSPTFPIHSRRKNVESSPGTTLLWDAGYASAFPEMGFLPAAVLLSRVVSKPAPGIVCLDLGHKAIAPEMPFPRARIFGMEDCEQLGQSEEHFLIRYPASRTLELGQEFYMLPMHICPTVARYPQANTVKEGRLSGSWKVAARDHTLTI